MASNPAGSYPARNSLSSVDYHKGFNNIASYVIIGYLVVTLVGDSLLIVFGLSVISSDKERPLSSAEIASGKIFLVSTTVISFLLGLIVLLLVALRRHTISVIFGVVLILFLWFSLRFYSINFSLLGLSGNAILTLIGLTLIFLVRGWIKFNRESGV